MQPLKEEYKRLFKGRTATTDKKLVTEAVKTIIVPANDADDMNAEARYFQSFLKKAGVKAEVEVGVGELEIKVPSNAYKKAVKTIEAAGYQIGWNESVTEDNPAAYDESPELSNEDYTYFADQLDEFNQQAEELHQEIGSPIEMAAEESMYAPRYEMQEKQLSRYFQTIFKSIENCKKFLIKQGRISDS
jgi:hypothetical protein